MLGLKNNRQKQLRFHRVNFLTLTAGYARKEAQVNGDMQSCFNNTENTCCLFCGTPTWQQG